MKALTITDLRRGKGPIWVLNQGIKRDRDHFARSYGEVIIEVRNPHPKIVKDIRKWAKTHRSSTERQEAVDELDTWMYKRASETGAHFVNGRAKNAEVVELANDLVRKVENNESLVEVRNMVLPQTWLPLCVTNEFKRKTLLNTPSFIKAVKDGVLVPISEEDARALLESDDAEEELDRLDRQRHARAVVENIDMLVIDSSRMDSRDLPVLHLEADDELEVTPSFNMPPVIPGTPRHLPVELGDDDEYNEEPEEDMDEDTPCTQIEKSETVISDVIVDDPYRPWWKRLLFWR